jgi:hypothetical protein
MDPTVQMEEGTLPTDQNPLLPEEETEYLPGVKKPREPFYMPFLRFYVCEVFGHRYHITEVMCIFAFGAVIALAILVSLGIPAFVLSIVLSLISLVALVFIWDIAKVKTLAALATKLEKVWKSGAKELEHYRRVNNSLEEQANIYTKQLDELHEGVNDIEDSAGKTEALLGKLDELQEQHEGLNRVQMELGDSEDKYAFEQQAINKDKDKELVKNEYRVMFETFQRCPNRPGVAVADGFALEKTKEFFSSHNLKLDAEVTAELQLPVIHLYVLIVAIDKQLDTRFYRLKYAANERAKLEKEAGVLQEELESLKAKHDKEIAKLTK